MTRDRTPAPCTGTTGPLGMSCSKVFLLLVKTVKTSACPAKETELGLAHWPCPHKRATLFHLLNTERSPWARRERLSLRPYHPERARSRLILEAKQGRAWLVPGWERAAEATDTGVCRQWLWEGRISPWDRGERQQMDLKAELSETGWILREGSREIRWEGEVPMGTPFPLEVQGSRMKSAGLFFLHWVGSSFEICQLFWRKLIVIHCVFGKRPLMWQEGLGGRTEIILSFCRNTHPHPHTPISSCRDPRLAQ